MPRQEPELFLERESQLMPDRNGDPLDGLANLFDAAILIGIGFMIFALSSFGLRELVTGKSDLTIVKNPGTASMEIITKTHGKIERMTTSKETAQGRGTAIGVVYRLEDGRVVWVPGGSAPATGTPRP
jgi:hypothetical protein